MATGSGLDSQLVVGEESAYGTPVTPDTSYEFNSESLALQVTWLEPTGLAAGRKFKRSARQVQSRSSVSGDFTVEHATKGMGLLWAHALASGATPTVVSGGTLAFEQIHTPGDYRGKSLTVQVGRPEPGTGTVRPHTFAGCKVTGWEFSLTDGEVPTLQLTIDGRSESTSTALVTASYPAGNAVFNFKQATLTLGGTASTTAGLTTVTGGTSVAASVVVNSVSISGETPMATERFGIGNAGLKNEPLENDTPTITGTLEAEFNKVDLYDRFVAGDSVPAVLTFTSDDEIETGSPYVLEFVLPSVKIKNASPAVGGPDLVTMSTEIEATDDETNPPIQVRIVSTDSAL